MSSFLDFFQITIGTVTQNKHLLVDVKSSVTIYDALLLMKQHNITILPVYEAPSSSSSIANVTQIKEYIGIISINDIVTFIINLYINEAERIADCLSTSVYEIIGVTRESSIDLSLIVENENTSMSLLLDKFCQGLHRCIVFDGEDHNRHSAKLLTQTDVVKYLLENINIYSEVETSLSMTVGTIMSNEDLVSVTENTLFVDALKHFKAYTAIPVVNEWGQVVANFSTSDLKSISIETTTDWSSFSKMTVKEFLTHGNNGQYKRPPVCITTEGTLFTAAKYMVDHHIHRVWVISPVLVSGVEGFGVGCLSLTDILRVINTFSTVNINTSDSNSNTTS